MLREYLLNLDVPAVAWLDPDYQEPAIETAKSLGFAYWMLNGDGIRDKEKLLDHIAKIMDFPCYFGKNWDALEDCLRSLDEEKNLARGYLILYMNPESLYLNEPDTLNTLFEVLRDSSESWRVRI